MQTLKKSTEFEELVSERLTEQVDQHFLQKVVQEERSTTLTLAARAFKHMESLKTADIIKAMFILPLEVKRQQQVIELGKTEIKVETFFWEYHLRDS